MSVPRVRINDMEARRELIGATHFAMVEATIFNYLTKKVKEAADEFPELIVQSEQYSLPKLQCALAAYQLSIRLTEVSDSGHGTKHMPFGSAKMRERYIKRLQSTLFFPPITLHEVLLRRFKSQVLETPNLGNLSLREQLSILGKLLEEYVTNVSKLVYDAVNNVKSARALLHLDMRVHSMRQLAMRDGNDKRWSSYNQVVKDYAEMISTNRMDDPLRVLLCNFSTVTSTLVREGYLRTFVPVNLLTPVILDYLQTQCSYYIKDTNLKPNDADHIHIRMIEAEARINGIIDMISESSQTAQLRALEHFRREKIPIDWSEDKIPANEDDNSSEMVNFEIQKALTYQSAYTIQYSKGRGRIFLEMPDEKKFIYRNEKLASQLEKSRKYSENGLQESYASIFQRELIQRAMSFDHIRQALKGIPTWMNHHYRFGDTGMESVKVDKTKLESKDVVIGLTDDPFSIRFVVTIEPKVKALIFNEITDPIRSRLPGER